jgi:hypothetical protein
MLFHFIRRCFENGASYSSIEDWHPYAVQDGLLITGQNQLRLN